MSHTVDPTTPTMQRLTSTVGVVGIAAGVVALGARALGDFDLPWHIAAGREMVATRSLLLRDDFSYTFRGARPMYQHLGEVVLFATQRLGGFVGLHALAMTCCAALAALLIARAGGLARALGLALAALSLIASAAWLVVRPALFSFPLLCAVLWVLERHRADRRIRTLVWLVPLQLLWANLHGFAILGSVLCAGYAAYTAACRVSQGRLGSMLPDRDGHDALRVIAVSLAAAIATCASPNGWNAFTAPFAVAGHDVYITEWAHTTPAFIVQNDPALAILIVGAVVALAWGRDNRGAVNGFDLAVVSGSLALALLRVRLIPVFAIASAPWIARRLDGRLEAARGRNALAWIATLVVAPSIVTSPGYRPGLGFDARDFPLGAVDFVASHPIDGPVFNFMPFGGYLIWRLYPQVRVFIDGRTASVYPSAFLDAYARAQHDPTAFAALERRFGFQWAIVRAAPGERFSEPIAADRSWVLVYLDDAAAVYVRADGPNRALASRGYYVLRHLSEPGLVLLHPPPAEPLSHDAALAVSQAPRSPRAHVFAAAAAAEQGDWSGVRSERARIAEIDPEYPGLRALDALLASHP